MNIERKRSFIINTVYYVIIAIIAYLVIKYALDWLMPFILAFILVTILQPVIKPVKKIFKTKNDKIGILVLVLIYVLIALGIGALIFQLVVKISQGLSHLPEWIDLYLMPTVSTLFNDVEGIFGSINPDILSFLTDAESTLMSIVSSLGGTISEASINFLSSFVPKVPTFFISTVIFIISSFFIAIDYSQINAFILAQCSPKVKSLIYEIKDYITNTLLQIVFAYFKIMSITFVELSIGLCILGVNNFILFALLIAMFDILPVFGTGGVMIPWVLYSFINKDFRLGIGLLILYLVITVIRNIIEPKIVGKQVGIHPLLMLISIFAGVKIFGVLGLVICPVSIIIIKNLNETGKIHLYNIPNEKRL